MTGDNRVRSTSRLHAGELQTSWNRCAVGVERRARRRNSLGFVVVVVIILLLIALVEIEKKWTEGLVHGSGPTAMDLVGASKR